MKLWHDDVRKPPDESWVWARTNEKAKEYLETGQVVEISMDHDLGGHDLDENDPNVFLVKGQASETGYDLVNWMVEFGHVPPKVTVHSWNPGGARAMAARLNYHGYDCLVSPFTV